MKLYLIITLLTFAAAQPPQPWQQLQRKMTESQVADLLGNPNKTETVGRNLVWYYQDTPRQRDGQIVWRPKTGFVHFKQIAIDGQDIFMLYGWKPPHPEDAPPTTPPTLEDKISPDNPLAQLEQIEKVYMEQLQTLDSEQLDSHSPGQHPAAPGLSIPQLFNKIPRRWLFGAAAGICLATILFILRPRRQKPKRKRYDFTQP